MNPSRLFLTAAGLPLVMAMACVRVPDVAKSTVPGKTEVESLIVPAGFDWKITTDVLCDFTSPHPSRVALSTSAAADPFAVFVTGGGRDNDPVYVNLPKSAETVYVRYETDEGYSPAVAVGVTGGRVSFSVPAHSKHVADETSPEEVSRARGGIGSDPPYYSLNGNMILYPAQEEGWGTLMFEDLWPAYGDYDFNDLVVGYKIQLYMSNRNKVREMVLGVWVKAIGGSLPNDLYLRLTGVSGGEIASCEKLQSFNDPADAQLVLLNPGNSVKDPAVFRFEGIKTHNNRPAGSIYLNTEPGFKVPDDKLFQATFYVEFRNSIKLADVAFETFDFFIARPDDARPSELRETHQGGYEPTPFGRRIYTELAAGSSNTDRSPGPYYSNANLVWALNIPATIPHVYEGTDFTKAYPNFAAWAVSGGTSHSDWYADKDDNRIEGMLVK